MKEVHDLFVQELRDIHDAERQLVSALGKAAKAATDPEIRQGFRDHQKETRRHVERVREAFRAVGERPAASKCAGMAGLIREQSVMTAKRPSPGLRDLYLLGAAQKVEGYEISAYESLIDLAERAGLDEAVEPLQENLMEERSMMQLARSLHREFEPELEGREPARRTRSKEASRGKARAAKVRRR